MREFVGKDLRGSKVFMYVGTDVEERLAKTCFRGQGKALAGNFLRWDSLKALFSDADVRDEFVNELVETLRECRRRFQLTGRRSERFSCNIRLRKIVGWASTKKIKNLSTRGLSSLKDYCPNKRSKGLMVKDRTTLAPLTKRITIVYQVLHSEDEWTIFIHSVYPGPDIGELYGRITEREGVAFFDWEHPGEPIPSIKRAVPRIRELQQSTGT